MKITDTHVYFWGGTFSNWCPATFSTDADVGIKFLNTEQAFMWYKADFFGDLEIRNKIEHETDGNPKEAKKLGRLIRGFDAEKWVKASFTVMVDVNRLKYMQNPKMAKELLDTGNRILVEASPYDKIWGVALGEDDPLILDEKNWQGQNLLGKALMEVRQYLKEEKLIGHLLATDCVI